MTIKKPRRLIVDQPFPHSHEDSSSVEEEMFSKVTLPSTLHDFIFSAKDVCMINLSVSCYAVAIWPVTGQDFQNTKWPAVLYYQ